MKVFIVDDEKMVLEDTKRSVIQAFREMKMEVDSMVATQSWKQALILAQDEKPDIAFLDINIPGKNGLDLGREFQAINPKVNIIYITAYDEYAVQAYRIHASGYLLKPVDVDDVKAELASLRFDDSGEEESGTLRVQCFGNFEVFYDERVVSFRRQKTKELFAFLVDQKGTAVSAEEICKAIFANDGNDEKHKNTLRVLSMELKQLLENMNLSDVYIHTRNAYAIAANRFECDYYEYLKGKGTYANVTDEEYMRQYSWAHMQKV